MSDTVHSTEDVFERVKQVLEELFDIEPQKITSQSLLYDDLDIDSIDAVDLIIELKKITSKRMKPEDFKAVRTVQDVVDQVSKLINVD